MKVEHYDVAALSDLLLRQLRLLIDGNQAKAADLRAGEALAEAFTVQCAVKLVFSGKCEEQRVAGGAVQGQDFQANRAAFEQQTQLYLQAAEQQHELRQDFLDDAVAKGADFLFEATQERCVHDFGCLSLTEACGDCAGRGDNACSRCRGKGNRACGSCGGSGKRTELVPEYRNNQFVGNRTEYRPCYGCGGNGRETCSACRGSGRTLCHACSGHGFFRVSRQVQLMVSPQWGAEHDCRFAASALQATIQAQGVAFLAERLPFVLQHHGANEEGSYYLLYEGQSVALHQPFRLKARSYDCYAFSNPPYAYVRPAVFDDLFADELAYLQQQLPPKGTVSRAKAFGFFKRYAGQPVLDEAMRGMARSKNMSAQRAAAELRKACQGFISDEKAAVLGEALLRILGKVSPAYIAWVWWLMAVPTLLFLTLYVEERMEAFFTRIDMGLLVALVLNVVLIFSAAALLAFGFSAALTILARRNIPLEYQQAMYNRLPLRQMRIWGLRLMLAAALYAFLAMQAVVPASHGRLLAIVRDYGIKLCAHLPAQSRPAAWCEYVFAPYVVEKNPPRKQR